MSNSLDDLVDQGVLSEVVARLKSGKEADVYLVRYSGKVVAAKVYKDRAQRSFKNNAAYKEGRSVRNSRSQRAIDKGSKFGKVAEEDAWKATEVATLYKLHAAGVRTPEPILFIDGVLLMEVVRGEDGETAPRLIDVDLTEEQATAGYHDMLTQLVRILSCDLIHGDLSPYNVLWGARGPTIIDFPQAISAAHNNSSEGFFLRDARNILDYFVSLAPSLRARSGDAREIWRAYLRRELTQDFVPTGRQRPEEQQRRQGQQGPEQQRGQHQERGGTEQRASQERANPQHGRRGPDARRPSQQGTNQPQQQRGNNNQRPSDQRQQPQQQRGNNNQRQQPQQQRATDQRRSDQRQQPHQQRAADQRPSQPQPQRRPPGRPRAPEVIVMTRRSRPVDDDRPVTAPSTERRNTHRR